MIPIAIPNLIGNEGKYLQDCIESTFVSSVGPFVNKFEGLIAESVGVSNNAVAVSSGTAGLHASLVAIGVCPGDLVIIPSLTFIATANAVSYCNAEPWILDIDNVSWTLNPDILESELSENTQKGVDDLPVHKKTGKRVSAIIPVFTLGMPANMERISAISRKYKLPIVVDAAAAIGANYKSSHLGLIDFDLMVFSFNGNKTITSGGGGAIVSNSKNLLNYLRHLTTTARVGANYDHDLVGFNYRMTNIQAAVGCAQIELINEFINRKREIALFYKNSFAEIEGLQSFPNPVWGESSCWLSGFLMNKGNSRALIERIRLRNIESRLFWKPIHQQLPYLNCQRSDCSVSEAVWDRIIILPSSTGISDAELNLVVKVVIEEISYLL